MIRELSGKHMALLGLLTVTATLGLLAPMLSGGTVPALQSRTLAIVLITLALWATGVVPSYLPSLLLFAVALILGLAPPDLIFAGFGSTAVWLIVSGFVIGAAISTTGLGGRLAELISPPLTGSYPRLIGGLMLVAMLLGAIMPSSVGRAVVMVPIGMALAQRCGFGSGSNGRIGIAVVLALGCNLPSFAILPSNIPNMILSGAAETIHHTSIGYTEYLLLHYPVLGVMKAVLTVLLILRFFPDRIATLAPPETASTAGRQGAQRRVALVLLVTLAFWMTDRLHGINPAWVGLAAATFLLMPKAGVVEPQAFRASVDFGMLLFVAGALALGAMVNASGLGAELGHVLERVLPMAPGRDLLNFLSLSLMASLTGLVATVPSVPTVLTPMAGDLAQLSGFGLKAVLMTQVVGFSTVIFPYQVAPLLVAMQLSGERLSHLARVLLPLAVLTVVVLIPLDYLWWRLLGWI